MFYLFSFASNKGPVFLYDCRASERIPIYLVVHGVFLIVVIILRLVQSRCEKDRKKGINKKKTRTENCIELITTLIHIFLFLWFFYGKYTEYSIWQSLLYMIISWTLYIYS